MDKDVLARLESGVPLGWVSEREYSDIQRVLAAVRAMLGEREGVSAASSASREDLENLRNVLESTGFRARSISEREAKAAHATLLALDRSGAIPLGSPAGTMLVRSLALAQSLLLPGAERARVARLKEEFAPGDVPDAQKVRDAIVACCARSDLLSWAACTIAPSADPAERRFTVFLERPKEERERDGEIPSYYSYVLDFRAWCSYEGNVQLNPSLRGEGRGLALVRAREESCKALGVPLIVVNRCHNPAFWRHLGYGKLRAYQRRELAPFMAGVPEFVNPLYKIL